MTFELLVSLEGMWGNSYWKRQFGESSRPTLLLIGDLHQREVTNKETRSPALLPLHHHVYIVSASENHSSDHLLDTQYLHFKTHFFLLRKFGLTSRKIQLLKSAIRTFCILIIQLLIWKKYFIPLHSRGNLFKAWNKEPWSKHWWYGDKAVIESICVCGRLVSLRCI